MFEPLDADDGRRLAGHGGRLGIKRLFASPSPDLPGSIREAEELPQLSISSDEAIRLSAAFVESHVSALGKLIPRRDPELRCPILFMPIKNPLALHYPIDKSHYCVLSLGLTELLTHQSTVSVWQSQMRNLQSQLGATLEQVSLTAQFFNFRSLMFLKGYGTLPRLEEEVAPSIRRRGAVLAQVAIAFVMLHEIGHGKYATLGTAAREHHRESIKLNYPETPFNASKVEELFADTYALSRFPSDAQGPVIQASTTFFNLLNYLEIAGFIGESTHPSSINRVFNLIHNSSAANNPSEDWLPLLEKELEKMRSFIRRLREWRRQSDTEPASFFAEIEAYLSKRVDWRQTVRACNILMSDKVMP